jgi:hypothetical protein
MLPQQRLSLQSNPRPFSNQAVGYLSSSRIARVPVPRQRRLRFPSNSCCLSDQAPIVTQLSESKQAADYSSLPLTVRIAEQPRLRLRSDSRCCSDQAATSSSSLPHSGTVAATTTMLLVSHALLQQQSRIVAIPFQGSNDAAAVAGWPPTWISRAPHSPWPCKSEAVCACSCTHAGVWEKANTRSNCIMRDFCQTHRRDKDGWANRRVWRSGASAGAVVGKRASREFEPGLCPHTSRTVSVIHITSR